MVFVVICNTTCNLTFELLLHLIALLSCLAHNSELQISSFVFYTRCIQHHPAALQISTWAQRLLWKVPSHRQPEALPRQGLPQHVRGREADSEPANQPHYTIRPEQRLRNRWDTRALGGQTNSVSHSAGRQETRAPVRCPGSPLRPTMGGRDVDGGVRVRENHAGLSFCWGARPRTAAGITPGPVGWRETPPTRTAEPRAERHRQTEETHGTRSRRAWVFMIYVSTQTCFLGGVFFKEM